MGELYLCAILLSQECIEYIGMMIILLINLRLEGYSYETIGGYYYLINKRGSSSPLKLASSEFIDLKLDEIRNNIIDEIFE